jgi:hypothetical protein
MISRSFALSLLVLCWLLAAGPSQAQQTTDQQIHAEIQRKLTRAETWYWWARASENAVDHHRRSELAYREAKVLILTLPEDQQDHLLSRADAGLEQVEARIDNSWDIFRSLYAPVWWFLEADPTLETSDDVEMRAVANAWHTVHTGVFSGERVDQYWAVVRCWDCRVEGLCEAGADDSKITCQQIRDELMTHIDGEPRLGSLTDDRLRSLLPWDWQHLTAPGSVPEPQMQKLSASMDHPHILLLDLAVTDVIQQESGVLRGVRIDLAAKVWDRDRGVISTVQSVGMGADAWSRVAHRLLWIGAMLLGALAAAVGWGLFRDREDDWSSLSQRSDDLVVAGTCWTLGALVGWLASQVSAGLLPAWNATAISSLDGPFSIPRAEALQWPLAHGAVVLLGSIMVSALLAPRLLPRLSPRLRDNVDLGIVSMSALAGALAMLFAPLVQAQPGEGWTLAAKMSAAALGLGAATVPSLSHILGQRFGRALHLGWGEEPRHPHLGTFLGFVSLLFLLPLGFFDGWLTATLIGGGSLAALTLFCGLPRPMMETALTERADHAKPEESRADLLQHPAWTLLGDRDPAASAVWLGGADGCRLMLIEGGPSSGKTRFMEEIRTHLTADGSWEVGLAHGRDPVQEGGRATAPTEAYDLIIQTLHSLGLGLSHTQIRQQAGQRTAIEDAFEAAVTNLPGFGLLFELTVSGRDEDLTEHKIHCDMVKAIRSLARKSGLLLCLDDIQWADPSSVALLRQLVSTCKSDPREDEHIVVIATTWPERDGERQKPLERLRTLACSEDQPDMGHRELCALGYLECRAFFENAGLSTAAATALSQVVGRYTQGRPGELVDFVRTLLQEGMLCHDEHHSIVLSGPLDPKILERAIPASSRERYHRLLEALNDGEIALLECAALCGRVFAVDDVAAGLQRSRMEVVQGLRAIEDRHGLVVDPEEPDDHFAFSSSILQSALIDRLDRPHQGGESGGSRELAKEMHGHIARALIERGPQGNSLRIAGHCLGAGPRMAEVCVEQATNAARQAKVRYAWQEMRVGIDMARQALEQIPKDQLYHRATTRLAWLEACELRVVTDGKHKHELIALLWPLVDQIENLPDGWPAPWDLVYTYLESLLDGRQAPWLERLLTDTRKWLMRPRWGNELTRMTATFYRVCADHDLGHAEDPYLALESLEKEIEQLPQSRERDLLLSMAQNRRANTMLRDKKRRHPASHISALFHRSNELKERHGDRRGLAIGLGSLAGVMLFRIKDYHEAYSLLAQDLELVRDMGFTTDESSILNRQAIALWEMAQEDRGTERLDKQLSALSNSLRATSLAIQFHRSGDFGFAATNVRKFVKALRKAGKRIRAHEDARSIGHAVRSLADDLARDSAMERLLAAEKPENREKLQASVEGTIASVDILLEALTEPTVPHPTEATPSAH